MFRLLCLPENNARLSIHSSTDSQISRFTGILFKRSHRTVPIILTPLSKRGQQFRQLLPSVPSTLKRGGRICVGWVNTNLEAPQEICPCAFCLSRTPNFCAIVDLIAWPVVGLIRIVQTRRNYVKPLCEGWGNFWEDGKSMDQREKMWKWEERSRKVPNKSNRLLRFRANAFDAWPHKMDERCFRL